MEDRTRRKLYLIFAIVVFFALFNLIVIPLALKGIRIDNESTVGMFSIIYYLYFLPFLLSLSLVTLVCLKLNKKIATLLSLIGFILGYSLYFFTSWSSLSMFNQYIWAIMYASLILLWPLGFLFPSGEGGMIVWVFAPATTSLMGGIIGAYISFLIRKYRERKNKIFPSEA